MKVETTRARPLVFTLADERVAAKILANYPGISREDIGMFSLRAGHIKFREGIPERSLKCGSSLMQIFQERSQTPSIRRIRHRVGEDGGCLGQAIPKYWRGRYGLANSLTFDKDFGVLAQVSGLIGRMRDRSTGRFRGTAESELRVPTVALFAMGEPSLFRRPSRGRARRSVQRVSVALGTQKRNMGALQEQPKMR